MREDLPAGTKLFDRIYASLLGGAIGDAMGGPVEGWHYERIVAEHGVVNHFLPYTLPPEYHHQFVNAPGTITDDTRLNQILCRAILDRGDLPRRGDFLKACADAYYGSQSELERGFLEEYVLAGLYERDKLAWGGQPTNGFIMANSPVGLICPCDPALAFELSFELDYISGGYARYSSALAAAAVAAAMVPGATVESLIADALAAAHHHHTEGPLTHNWPWYHHVFHMNQELIEKAVEIAQRFADVFAVRAEYYDCLRVGAVGSEAAQSLAVALGMMVAARGDLPQAIIGCVNYGRDNDSYATIAGAILGALHGTAAVPEDWQRTVETANPTPAIYDLAVGLADVAVRRHREQQAVAGRVKQLLGRHEHRPT